MTAWLLDILDALGGEVAVDAAVFVLLALSALAHPLELLLDLLGV